jgi:hypothetical protein
MEQAGQLVTKEALLQAVWPDTVVSEGVLTTCIGELREELGETAQAPRFIQTVHRRGYMPPPGRTWSRPSFRLARERSAPWRSALILPLG